MTKRENTVLAISMMAIVILALVATARCQIPDTPQPQPAAKCGPWSCYELHTIPTKDVFKSKSYWAFVGTDFALSTANAKTSADAVARGCVEIGNGFYRQPSFGDYMRANIPETAATAVVGFLWLKVKGPKWVMPLMLGAPAVVHGRGIYAGVTCP